MKTFFWYIARKIHGLMVCFYLVRFQWDGRRGRDGGLFWNPDSERRGGYHPGGHLHQSAHTAGGGGLTFTVTPCDLCTVTFVSELFCLCQDEAKLDLTVSDVDLTEAAWCSTVTICAVKSFVDVVLNAWAPRVYQVVSNLCTKRGLIHCWMH